MKQTCHIVFKTHLDIGFTNFASVIEKNYLDSFIPDAIALAEETAGDKDCGFVWTVGSWILCRALDTYRGKQLKRLESAVADGFIRWHALPFTTHSELLTPSLLEFALTYSQRLDATFATRTRCARMTDVPGHTRGIIPILAAAGIDFLHLGCNPASTPPAVPELFRWADPQSSAAITVMYQDGGYGRVFDHKDSGAKLYVCFTGDNLGPPAISDVREAFAYTHGLFPRADIRASSFDSFADDLFADLPDMPVITAELGDTWIHGAGTAPGKVRNLRELQRLRDEWIARGIAEKHLKKFHSFSENLLLVCEHTWGLDVKTHLADSKNFSPAALRRSRAKNNFANMEQSWAEQEAYITTAVDSLKGTPVHREAAARLATIAPSAPDWHRYGIIKDRIFVETDFIKAAFDSATGAIISLTANGDPRDLLAPDGRFGSVQYQQFGSTEINRFLKQYSFLKNEWPDWYEGDFGKPGIGAALENGSTTFASAVKAGFGCAEDGAAEILFELSIKPPAPTLSGAPRRLFIRWQFASDAPVITAELIWKDKPATRVPEALWIDFVPHAVRGARWHIEKLGRRIDPRDVISKGNRRLHATGKYVEYHTPAHLMHITPLDSPLTAPGGPSLYNFDNKLPAMSSGISFNLFNTMWGTNFPQWISEDGLARFVIQIAQAR